MCTVCALHVQHAGAQQDQDGGGKHASGGPMHVDKDLKCLTISPDSNACWGMGVGFLNVPYWRSFEVCTNLTQVDITLSGPNLGDDLRSQPQLLRQYMPHLTHLSCATSC